MERKGREGNTRMMEARFNEKFKNCGISYGKKINRRKIK